MPHISTTAIVFVARKLARGCRHAQLYWNSLPPERQEELFRMVEERLARSRVVIERRLGPQTSKRLDQFLLWARENRAAG